MKMNRLSISALIMATALPWLPAGAQTSQKITAGKASEYGLVYSLPVTALDIYLVAELEEAHPGEFQNYARRHLGAADAVTADSRSARLTDVVVVPRGTADPDQRWLAQFKAGSTPFMILNSDNIPLAVNTENVAESTAPAIPAPKAAAPSPLEGEAARQAVTQEMARSSSTSKRAELAAQRIFELRETRSDILSGQADNPPADGKAMQLVLDNLAAQEAALTAMFTGVKSASTIVEKVTVTPDSAGVSDKIIARLSAVDGFVAPDNLAGAPVRLTVKLIESGAIPAMENGSPKAFPKGGVAYRIPGRALVSVEYAGRTIAEQEVAIAQSGAVFGLDPKLFTDKKEPSQVQFDPATGAIIELGPVK